MNGLEDKIKHKGFMEERFRERLRTSRKIENLSSSGVYHREKMLVNRVGERKKRELFYWFDY